MSMHEIEDTMEETVRFVDSSVQEELSDKRSIIASIYKFQCLFDTKDTLFRVIDILLKERYMYALPLSNHPDYRAYKDYFDTLDERTPILRNPTQEWSEENPEVGAEYYDLSDEAGEHPLYNDTDRLFVTAGLETWKRLVDQGTLTGVDATEPLIFKGSELGCKIISSALKDGNTKLAATWYKLVMCYASIYEDNKLWKDDSAILHTRELAKVHNLVDITIDYEEYVDGMREDPADDYQAEFLSWWFFKDTE